MARRAPSSRVRERSFDFFGVHITGSCLFFLPGLGSTLTVLSSKLVLMVKVKKLLMSSEERDELLGSLVDPTQHLHFLKDVVDEELLEDLEVE